MSELQFEIGPEIEYDDDGALVNPPPDEDEVMAPLIEALPQPAGVTRSAEVSPPSYEQVLAELADMKAQLAALSDQVSGVSRGRDSAV